MISASEAPSRETGVSGSRSRLAWWAGILLLALIWGRLFFRLSFDWVTDPQWSHGWFVPFLAIALFAARWPTRPPPKRLERRAGILCLLAGGVLALAPIQLLQVAFPEARPFQWVHAALAVAISGLALLAVGGWPWLRHFCLPVLFMLFAVPWPRAFQNDLTQSLMQAVAQTSVECAQFLGIAAERSGSIIRITPGVVGIDEACSGIRSLQGSLMVAVFLGEYYLLTPTRRILLIATGVVVAVMFNVVRALILTWVGATQGIDAIHKFHDPAGFGILALVFVTLLGISMVWQRLPASAAQNAPSALAPRPLPLPFVVGVVVAVLAIDAGAEWYYRGHERGLQRSFAWSMNWGRAEGVVREETLTPAVRQFLRYDDATYKILRLPSGAVLSLVYMEWEQGSVSPAGSRLHTPQVCMPAIGNRLVESYAPRVMKVNGVDFLLATSLFEMPQGRGWVYNGAWETGAAVPPELLGVPRSLRQTLQTVKEGRRLVNAQALLAMVLGPETEAQASEILRQQLERMVVPR
ncbi:MAG: exosortase/archaeosortase family protein [Verrucomicrobiota bacterium]|nr:exosortase/archaeosortase family protein [Verrucomicrobiota bacterium]